MPESTSQLADFALLSGYYPPGEAAGMTGEVEEFLQRAYTEDNLENRRAYPSAVARNRKSFGFSVHVAPCPETAGLPGLTTNDLPGSLRIMTERVWVTLGKPKGRLLFNVQMYGNNSLPIPAHFDGEYFEFHSESGTLRISRAIRPRLVALLTLSNHAANGGTTLVGENGGPEQTISSGPGDLLLINNLRYKHRVNSLHSDGPPVSRWIRQIIGWRALDDGCALFDGDLNDIVTVADAATAHRNFLSNWKYSSEVDAPF